MMETAPKASHDRCFPRLANNAVTADIANVVPITTSRLGLETSPKDSRISNTPNPNQETDVKCHAKRSVSFVN